MRRGWITAFLGIGALLASLWWLQRRPGPQAAETVGGFSFVLPVTLTRVERSTLVPSASLSGSVRAARRATLAFETSGLVESLQVREADTVEAGAQLAQLSAGDERQELSAARAALALAQRELELLQAGPREEEKRRLLAVLEAAQAEADLAQHEVERGAELLKERILSEAEMDVRRMEFRAADRRRSAAQEAHAQALAGSRTEDLAIARARVDEAGVRVATAQHNLEKTRLVAPWSGAIVQRMASVGAFVASGEGVFELVDLENLEVHLEIPGRYAPRLAGGGRVRLSVPGDERNAFETSLDATIQAADELARSFRAIVRLSAEEGRLAGLRPGLFCNAELYFEPLSDVLCIPSDALMASEGGSYLVRAAEAGGAQEEGGRPSLVAEFLPVRVLAESGATTAVEPAVPGATLAVGDRICLVGADNAFPGAPLMPRVDGGAGGGGAPGPGGAREAVPADVDVRSGEASE